MNEFSIICRILGSLFNRQPQDPLLAPLFSLLREGKLKQSWPLEQDELLDRLQQSSNMQALATDYSALFVGEDCRVSPYGSHWENGPQEPEVRQFLQARGMPLSEAPADHIGQILLASSWFEDQDESVPIDAQITLFDNYLMPWCGVFLGKMEAHAITPFYRALAALTRDAIQAMREELEELDEDDE